jgi:hypothetical protein
VNPETFQEYVSEQERQLALMRGENLQPTEKVKQQVAKPIYNGMNRHERRKTEKQARREQKRVR